MKKTLYDWCIENHQENIIAEWDYEANKPLTPKNISYGCKKKVFWKCSKNHKWEVSPNNRTSYLTGCPYCSNKKVLVGYNDLATTNPELALEWNYKRNYPFTPQDYTAGSSKKVWWKCVKGHEWQAVISSRKNRGCPECSKEKQTSFPEQAILFYLSKYISNIYNRYKIHNIECDIYLPDLKLGIEYDGELWHKDIDKDLLKINKLKELGITLVNIREPKCPRLPIKTNFIYCLKNRSDEELTSAIKYIFNIIDKKIKPIIDIKNDRIKILENSITLEKKNSLNELNSILAKEWNHKKNGSLTPDMFKINSTQKVWWKCKECGHEWDATIASRNAGNGCPLCSNKTVVKGLNDLATIHPNIIKEWNYEKNENITPDMFTSGSSKKVWWKCSKGHEWQAIIYTRAKGAGCPYCTNKKLLKGFNDLKTLKPDIASYWDYKNNTIKPDEIMPFANKKVWWICPECGKSYKASIAHRSSGHNDLCNECKKRHSSENLRLTKTKGRELSKVNPKLAKDWDYTKNTTYTPNNIAAGSDKKVWWICQKCGYNWQAIVKDRNRGSGCPKCHNKIPFDENIIK